MVNCKDAWLLQTALILSAKGENLCIWMLPNNLKGEDCCAKLSLIELVGNMSSLCADMIEISLCANMMEITTELVTQAEALGRLDVW